MAGHDEDEDLFDDSEFDDSIKCNWRFIATCYVFPMTNGLMNGYAWSGASLYFRSNSWSLVALGLCSMAGFFIRVCAASLYFKLGYWLALPLALVHFGCLIPALLFPANEVCICIQLAALSGWGRELVPSLDTPFRPNPLALDPEP